MKLTCRLECVGNTCPLIRLNDHTFEIKEKGGIKEACEWWKKIIQKVENYGYLATCPDDVKTTITDAFTLIAARTCKSYIPEFISLD